MSKTMTVTVYASEGKGRVKVECPFGGRKIFFASEYHSLARGNRFVMIPPGVAYVHNTDLARRTDGKVRHLLVTQGLFHLLRLTIYATKSSADEIQEMYARRGQIRKEAAQLLESGIMTEEEHAQILREITFLERHFLPPKRAVQKLAAGKNLVKAHALGASGNRRKDARAPLTAYAAGKRVTIRISDLGFITRYFSGETMRISATIRSYVEAVEDISEFFERPSNDRKSPKTRGAFFRLMDGLNIPAGRESALRMLRRRLSGYATSMSALTFMPYREVCERIASLLGHIDLALVRGVHPSALRAVDGVRRLLRQLRLLYIVETELVARLSWYLRRMPANIRSATDPDQIAFRAQFEKVMEVIRRRNSPADFHPRVILTAVELLTKVEQHLGDPEKAKGLLKDLTAALAKDPHIKIRTDEAVA
jgi:hypothetical protein